MDGFRFKKLVHISILTLVYIDERGRDIEKLLIERTRRATLCPYQVEIRPINIAIIKEFLPKCRFISINAFLQECRVPSSSARVYFKVRSKGCAVK